jgi:arylsulfatase
MFAFAAVVLLAWTVGPALAAKKPNILVIWGDDIGQSNISAYTKGMMGYQTPNIDRVAKEGIIFTDYYAEQSCTAGRAAFITGQSVFRTGLSKVGMPGAELTPLGSSAKTTWATGTKCCPPTMGSTSSTATFTT